jgi:hypothetical protein
MSLPDDKFVGGLAEARVRWQGLTPGTETGQLNPLVREAVLANSLASKADFARAYGELLARVYAESKTATAAATGAVSGDVDPARRQLIDILVGQEGRFSLYCQAFLYVAWAPSSDAAGSLGRDVARRAAEGDGDVDAELYSPRIFVRGSAAVLGKKCPRLRILSEKSGAHAHGSSRLSWRSITAPGNPLTARVIANQVWIHHPSGTLAARLATSGRFAASTTLLVGWLGPCGKMAGHRRNYTGDIAVKTWQQASDRADGRQSTGGRLLWRPTGGWTSRMAIRCWRCQAARPVEASRSMSPIPTTRGGRCTARSTGKTCRHSSARSISPAPTNQRSAPADHRAAAGAGLTRHSSPPAIAMSDRRSRPRPPDSVSLTSTGGSARDPAGKTAIGKLHRRRHGRASRPPALGPWRVRTGVAVDNEVMFVD